MKNALVDINKKRETILRGFSESSTIKKARSGVYADTAENKSKKRVGQKYGSKKEEDPKKEKTTKKEDQVDPKSKKKPEDPKKEGVAKTNADHAKDTSTEELQAYVDNTDQDAEDYDPDLMYDAKKELSSRSREGKSPAELEIMAVDKEMEGLQESIDEAIGIHDTMQNEKLKDAVYDSVTEGDAEMAKLKEKKKKLEAKVKKEKQPKITPEAYIATASVDDLAKRSSDLANESLDFLHEGNYNKAQKVAAESKQYADAILVKMDEAKKVAKEKTKPKEGMLSSIKDHIDSLDVVDAAGQLEELKTEIKRTTNSDSPTKESSLKKYNEERDYIVDKLSNAKASPDEAIKALEAGGHKDPTDGMISKKQRSLDFENKLHLTSGEQTYMTDNKKEILAMMDDDLFYGVKDAVADHKKAAEKK